MRPDRPIAPFLRAVETRRAEIPAAAFPNPARKQTVAKMAESNGKTAAHPQAPPKGAVSNPRGCAPFGLAQSAPIPFNRPGRFDSIPGANRALALERRLAAAKAPPQNQPNDGETRPNWPGNAPIAQRRAKKRALPCNALFPVFRCASRSKIARAAAARRSPRPRCAEQTAQALAPRFSSLPPPPRGRRWGGRGRGARLRASTPAPARPR